MISLSVSYNNNNNNNNNVKGLNPGVTVNNNSPIQDYVHPDDQTQPFEIIIIIMVY